MKALKIFLITTLIINSFAQTGFAGLVSAGPASETQSGVQYDCDRGVKFMSQRLEAEDSSFRGNRDFTLNLGLLTSYVAASLTGIGALWPIADGTEDRHRRFHHVRRKRNSEEWYARQRLNVELSCLEGLVNAVPTEELYRYSCSHPSRVEVRNGYRVQSQFMEHSLGEAITLEEAQEYCRG